MLAPGTALGPYVTLSTLGAGTYGAVYRCSGPGGAVFALKTSLLHDPALKGKKGAGPRQSDAAGHLYQEYLVLAQRLRWHPSLPVLASPPTGDSPAANVRWMALQQGRPARRRKRCT